MLGLAKFNLFRLNKEDLILINDSRDNRYNASSGSFLHICGTFYKNFIGSDFVFGPDYGPDHTPVRAFYIHFAEAF